MIAPAFPTIGAALAYWRDRDRTSLKSALTAPCDVLGDEEHDLRLAIIFRDIAGMDTMTARLVRIHDAIRVQEPMVRYARERGAEDIARRIERMLTVLEVWAAEIAGPAADARAA